MKSKKLPYLGVVVGAAFLSFLCGANINGDNGETLLWVGCIAFGLVAVAAIIAAIKTPMSH